MALNLKKLASPVLAASLLMMPTVNAFAATDVFADDKPSALAMYTDLLAIRPIGIVATALGAVTYVVALPFTLASGGAKEAGEVLVVEPALYTFVRCLGCSRAGYQHDDVTYEEEAEAASTAPAAETEGAAVSQ